MAQGHSSGRGDVQEDGDGIGDDAVGVVAVKVVGFGLAAGEEEEDAGGAVAGGEAGGGGGCGGRFWSGVAEGGDVRDFRFQIETVAPLPVIFHPLRS